MRIINFNIYYILTYSDILYFSALKKDFGLNGEEDEIFELFDNIEIQGIRKLTDKNGELSKIGKQSLKFCIEQSNKHHFHKNKSILQFFRMNKENDQNTNTISLLSTQLNETQNEGMNKLLNNEDNNENIDKKHEIIKDSSLDCNNEQDLLMKRMKCRKFSILFCFLSLIILIIICILYFKK